jgi:hypothetical protein
VESSRLKSRVVWLYYLGNSPLWNRSQDHGVITVYAGSEKRLTIEQDRVPMGATAIFKGLLDLVIVGYGESGI